MSAITPASNALSRNTTTTGFRSFRGAERTDGVTDQSKRILLRNCGLVRTTPADKASASEDVPETSMASLEALVVGLGLADRLASARVELSDAFQTGEGGVSLRSLRLRRGLSQRALASALGTSQPRIAAIECGHQSMGLAFARRMAAVLRVSLDVVGDAADRRSDA